MPEAHGSFVWYELMTTDAPAAEAFYKKVVGWSSRKADNPQTPYTIFMDGETRVAGLLPMPEPVAAEGGLSAWLGYIGVADVDDYAARVTAAGGRVHRPATDISGIGRFAVVSDPQGAVFVLFKGAGTPQPPAPPGRAGQVGWRELMAVDAKAALGFYGEMFGWTQAEELDMGGFGVYRLFAAGAEPIGGMMDKMAEMPVPFWTFYIVVDSIDAAISRVQEGGGSVTSGPHEVPGGAWVARGLDPQGAVFALTSPNP